MMELQTRFTTTDKTPAKPPTYSAQELSGNGKKANIVLGDQVYTLRITRAGKLILTK